MDSSRGKLKLSVDKLIVVLLFLFSLDLFDLSGVLISLTILLFVFFRFSTIKIDYNCGLLILFSVFYFGSVSYFEGFSIDHLIKFAIVPWGCYILGYNLKLDKEAISVTKLATILGIGFFIHGMLNLISSIQMYGSGFNNSYRGAYDFWQNREISVTPAALYYSPFALMCIGGVFFAKNKSLRILSFVPIVLSLYATLIYQNRTLIITIIVVLAFNVLRIIRNGEIDHKRKVYLIISVIAIGSFLTVGWITNLWGFRGFFEGTNLFSRLSGGNQDRTKIWSSFIFGEAWKYPFGGTKAVLYQNKPYVHNMWLDTFRRGGFFPFLFLVLFTIRVTKTIMLFIKTEKEDSQENLGIIQSLMLGIALMFMVEPIIEANPYIFYFPIIVIGTMCGKISHADSNV